MTSTEREGSFRFPEGFRWGTATSSFQVEGNNTGNDWWAWEQLPGRVLHADRSGAACGWWDGRAEEDFDRAASTGQNSHRLSIEWSRIEPGPGRWDEDALDRYRQMVRALRNRGIEPLVTLHHFTNPVWLAELGGWTGERVVQLFERYVRKVVAALRDDVDFWCTINEPNVYLFSTYVEPVFPPGRPGFAQALAVARHLVRAHAAAYHAIHELQPSARVGLAMNLRLFDPANPASPADRLLARYHHRLFNDLILLAAHDGKLRLPMRPEMVRGAAGTMDFLGVNYYTRDLVSLSARPSQRFISRFPTPGSEVGDGGYGEIYPEGLYRVLRWGAGLGLPIYITENGVPDAADRYRPRFIVTHLYQAWRAIQEGMPVLGYYHWSLVDNFEWQCGWTQRFGLWEMDPATQRRTLRRSGVVYSEICHTNGIAPELVCKYAPELGASAESTLSPAPASPEEPRL